MSQWARKIKQGWSRRYGICHVHLKPCFPNELVIVWCVITIEIVCEDRLTYGDIGAMSIIRDVVLFQPRRPGLTGLNISMVR